MLKKIAAALAALALATASLAAVEVNKGSAADLDGLKGVGPALSKRILDARQTGPFKDWPDFMSRVKGVKEKTAEKLSSDGLTVNGQSFKAVASGEARKAEPKPATAAAKAK